MGNSEKVSNSTGLENIREDFEKWYTNKCLGVNIGEGLDRCGDGYNLLDTHFCWLGWQARQPEIDALKARIAELEAAQTGQLSEDEAVEAKAARELRQIDLRIESATDDNT